MVGLAGHRRYDSLYPEPFQRRCQIVIIALKRVPAFDLKTSPAGREHLDRCDHQPRFQRVESDCAVRFKPQTFDVRPLRVRGWRTTAIN